jgi:hypothetical protein
MRNDQGQNNEMNREEYNRHQLKNTIGNFGQLSVNEFNNRFGNMENIPMKEAANFQDQQMAELIKQMEQLKLNVMKQKGQEKKCFNCGKLGHLRKDCRTRNRNLQQNNQGNFRNDNRSIKCYSCGKIGHYANNCNENRNNLQCGNCGRNGHATNACNIGSNSRMNMLDDDLYLNASNRKGKDVKFRRGQSKFDTWPSADVFSTMMNNTFPMPYIEAIKNHKGIEQQFRDYFKRHNIPETPMNLNLFKDAYERGTFDLNE